MTLDEFPFGQVRQWLQAGDIVPFVGAGASRVGVPPPKPPDGPTLATELIATMAGGFPSGGTGDLATIAQFFEHTVFDRAALYDYLHDRFEAQRPAGEVGTVASMLADIPRAGRLFMITTNYDSFIERAFAAAGKPLCVITQNMRVAGEQAAAATVDLVLPDGTRATEQSTEFQWNDPQRFPDDCAYLFKMHGSVKQSSLSNPDNVIITEDDYVDFMVNAGGAASPYFPPASLTAAYKRCRFLFLGYSLQDWNFRAFLRVLALRNALSGQEIRRHWAIQLSPDPVEVELWRHRNVSVCDGDLEEFCARLSGGTATGGP